MSKRLVLGKTLICGYLLLPMMPLLLGSVEMVMIRMELLFSKFIK